jgi:hypothetical protein
MVREDRVIMSVKELRRVHVIRRTMEKQLTQVKGGILLGLTPSHIRRLPRAGGAGRRPQARASGTGQAVEPTEIPDRCKAMALQRWQRERGVVHFTRQKRPHRAWQVRKAHVGELVQLDGSHHDWFEGRGSRCVLMAYIDDASSRVYARF